MREILFRGKDIAGNWYAGNLAVVKEDMHNGAGTIKAGSYISNEYGRPFAYQIRPETVSQFTGLTDKNGNKIFEGDIIKHNNTHFVVEFSANHLGFICIDRKHKTRGGFANWRDGNWMKNVSSYIQIIGNIHDNPELLT